MRVENTKIKLTIPIPINRPDCNGVIYTKEAVEDAFNNLQTNLPVLYKESADADEKVIGATTGTSHIVTWDYENHICKLTIDGVIFHSGADIIVNEIKDSRISDFRITGIGLTV